MLDISSSSLGSDVRSVSRAAAARGRRGARRARPRTGGRRRAAGRARDAGARARRGARRRAAAATTARAPASASATSAPSATASGRRPAAGAENAARPPGAAASAPSSSSWPAKIASERQRPRAARRPEAGGGVLAARPCAAPRPARRAAAPAAASSRARRAAGERQVAVRRAPASAAVAEQVAQLVQRERRGRDQRGDAQPRGHAPAVWQRLAPVHTTRHAGSPDVDGNPCSEAESEGTMDARASSSTSTPFPGSTTGPARSPRASSCCGWPRADGTAHRGRHAARAHGLRDRRVRPARARARAAARRSTAAGIAIELRRGGELGHDMVGRLTQARARVDRPGPAATPAGCWSRPRSRRSTRTSTPPPTSCATAASACVIAHPERSADAILDGAAGLRRELARGLAGPGERAVDHRRARPRRRARRPSS